MPVPLARLGHVDLRSAGYELYARLSRGGMAEIWAAARVGAHDALKPCIVKMIRPELAAEPSYRRLFVAEGRVGMMLDHTHIVSVFDVGAVGDRLFMAMDWVDGVDLATLWPRVQRVRGRPMAVTDAIYIVGALLDALRHVHELCLSGRGDGLVHHDVSPRNVMVGSRGEVKLMDFGLVGSRAERDEGEAPGFRGTLRYLAREQARGRPEPASDLFAVGAILHELLAGRRFRHACRGEEALLAEILLGGVPPLERQIPAPIESLRRGLLEPRSELRIKTAERALGWLAGWPGYRSGGARLEALYRQAIGGPRSGRARLLSLGAKRARLDPLRVWVEPSSGAVLRTRRVEHAAAHRAASQVFVDRCGVGDRSEQEITTVWPRHQRRSEVRASVGRMGDDRDVAK